MASVVHAFEPVEAIDNMPFGQKCGQHQWTAIILAGERPEGDPLAAHCNVKYKALIPIAGQSMLDHVAQALLASLHIGKIVIMAQSPNALKEAQTSSLEKNARVEFVTSNNGIATSIAMVAGSEIAPWPVLVALLTADIVDCFLQGCDDQDVAVGVVERETVMAAYPDTRRTWLKFRGGAYSGANLFALRNAATKPAIDLWSSVEQDRKNAWKIFANFGPWLKFRAISRTICFEEAMAEAGRRLALRAQPVTLPIAEAAIDVDKLCDLKLVGQILSERNILESNQD